MPKKRLINILTAVLPGIITLIVLLLINSGQAVIPSENEMDGYENHQLNVISDIQDNSTENVELLVQTGMNYDFVVRYPNSQMGVDVQLEVMDNSKDDWNWSSSNEQIATVDDTGLLTCGAQVGEAQIMAVSQDGEYAECWVYILEPEITYVKNGEYGEYRYIPEGNMVVNSDVPDFSDITDWETGIASLPTMQVLGGSFDQQQSTSVDIAVTDYGVDENGNPVVISETNNQDVTNLSNEVSISMGWKAFYLSGEYCLPEQLRYGNTIYHVTEAIYPWGYNTDLNRIYIPKTIVNLSIENGNPFSDYTMLEQIIVDEANPYYKSVDGVLFNADGTELIAYPRYSSRKEYAIPEGVTSIGKSAFDSAAFLEKITIPSTVSEIGQEAFINCNSLQEINLDPTNQAFKMQNGILFSDDGEMIAFSNKEMGTDYTLDLDMLSTGWLTFSDNSYIRNLTVIGTGQSLYISNCSNLENVVIEGSCQSVSIQSGDNLSSVKVMSDCDEVSVNVYGTEASTIVELNGKVNSFSASGLIKIINPKNIQEELGISGETDFPDKLSPSLKSIEIDLNNTDTDFNADVLKKFTQLNNLEFSGGSVKNLSALEFLPSLTSLEMYRMVLDDYSPVWSCSNLTKLDISYCEDFNDLSGVERLSNLKSIRIAESPITDVSPLSSCESLTEIIFSGTDQQLQNFDSLAVLPTLEQVVLNGASVSEEEKVVVINAGVRVY